MFGETQINMSVNKATLHVQNMMQSGPIRNRIWPGLTFGQLDYFQIYFSVSKSSSAFTLKYSWCICPCLCFVYVFPCSPQEVTHLPVDSHSHLYEDVRDGVLYQDILASSLPFPPSLYDHRLPRQRSNWRSPTYPQVFKQNPKLLLTNDSIWLMIYIC